MQGPDFLKVLKFAPEILEQGKELVDEPSRAKFLKGANGLLMAGGILLGLAALIGAAMGEIDIEKVVKSK